MHRSFALVSGLGLALFLGCGGSGSSRTSGMGTSATMNVHLVDGPIAGFQEVNVNIQKVEINSAGTWTTLGTPNRTVNLLNLVGGVDETLISGATLPAGQYGQMRLILGSGNTVKLSDGTVQPLKVPSGMESGIKLIVNFDVAAGTTKDVWIDFDAAHSIQVIMAGASGQYILRPTIWAFDKLVTGSIHGVLTDAAGGAPLAGATVYAEGFDGSGNAFLARTTTTDATGAYTLDLLPVGSTYYVVSQPVLGSTTLTVYDAKASDGFALSAATPVFTYSAAFTADTAVGGVSGNLTPLATSSQSDQVRLFQSLSTSSGNHTFILRSGMATAGTSTETYGFTSLPAGSYSLQALRATLNLDGTTTITSSTVQPATVTAGATATVNLTL
ncbi:DUF4382 domain-containing protein [Geothrix limicola]|nr:DUF4382 domain-containing protein [Geothrix limicola]